MIESLKEIDGFIVLFINDLWFSFFSEFMWAVSAKITWIPLYVFMLYTMAKNLNKKTLFLLIAAIIFCVACADLISVHLFKNIFMRYRPSHNLLLTDQLNFYEISPGNYYKGGEYGFVSSHAANVTALVTMFLLGFKDLSKYWYYLLIFVVLLICFSRIYLGVHYLSDVFCGSLLGALIAYLVYKLIFIPIQKKR